MATNLYIKKLNDIFYHLVKKTPKHSYISALILNIFPLSIYRTLHLKEINIV